MSEFRLSSGDQDFNSRVGGLFSCLQQVEKSLPQDGLVFEPSTSGIRKCSYKGPEDAADPLNNDVLGTDRDSEEGVIDRGAANDGRNEGFKRPNQSNIPSGKRFRGNRGAASGRPDYVINPKKWVRYDMKDTPVLNDTQNKKAALQLLSDLKHKKDEASNQEKLEELNVSGKVVFKKPSSKTGQKSTIEEMDHSATDEITDISGDFGGTKKFVLDEYVVGSKKKNKKVKTTVSDDTAAAKTKSEIKLSYLAFQDDEDCDSG